MSGVPNGFNPMRWDCERRGCFNAMCRPKIERFAQCFPNHINFGDVDGVVEINGNGLMLEWKYHDYVAKGGQHIMYTRFTRLMPITVVVVEGDASTMEVFRAGLYLHGVLRGPNACDFDGLCEFLRTWSQWALQHRVSDPQALEHAIRTIQQYMLQTFGGPEQALDEWLQTHGMK